MAENLVSTKGLNKPGIFTTMAEVKEAQQKFKNLGDTLKKKNNAYIKETIKKLGMIFDAVKEAETAFYSTLGAKDLEDFQKKVQEKLARLSGIDRNTQNIILNVQTTLTKEAMDKILKSPEAIKIFGGNKKNINKVALNPATVGNILGLELRSKNTDKNKFIDDFKFTIVVKGTDVKFNSENPLPADWLRIIRDKINELGGKKKNSSPVVSPYEIKQCIIKYINESGVLSNDITAKEVFINEIGVENYDVNLSTASLKGFLGEVKNATIFNLLYEGNIGIPKTAIPVGDVKNLKGQEIPIDLVVQNANFQIKNYKLLRGKYYRIGQKMQAGNFIEDRLQPNDTINNILKDFYGATQYNQPKTDASEEYKKIYKNFYSYSKETMPLIMKYYINNILKVQDTFQAQSNTSNLFLNEELYFNTFFIYKDEIVPSSAIIFCLIEQLQKQSDNFLRPSFSLVTPAGKSKEDSLYNEEGNKNNTKNSPSIDNLANMVSVRYNILIYASDIIEKAKSKAYSRYAIKRKKIIKI